MIIPLRFFLSLTLIFPLMAFGQLESTNRPRIPAINNLDQIVKDMKLERFKDKIFTRKIKVAILDDGMDGWKKEVGSRLPSDTVYEAGDVSDADKVVPGFHGLRLASVFADTMKKSGAKTDYELHLFYAFGLTKFKSAVQAIVAGNYDIVIYAQVWQWGGNGDGTGFIDALVNQATKAGVIWINASGDFGTYMRVAPVEAKDESGTAWVTFKDKTTDGVNVICDAPAGKECNLNLFLSWNDYKEDSEEGTDKDLDLFLFDKDGKQIASAEKTQVLATAPGMDLSKNSVYSREQILKKIGPGKYKARVKVKSANFKADKDVLKLMVLVSPGMSMENPSTDETILPPADNSSVIVVGASDAINTSHSTKMSVPEVYLNSYIDWVGGPEAGSSMATALAAVDATLELGTGTEKSKDAIVKALKTIDKGAPSLKIAEIPKGIPYPMPEAPVTKASWPARSLAPNGKKVVVTIGQQRQAPAPPAAQRVLPPEDYDVPPAPVITEEPNGCLHPIEFRAPNETVAGILRDGGVAVRFQGTIAIVVGFDVLEYRKNPTQSIFALPSGIKGANPDQIPKLRKDAVLLINSTRPICNY